MAHSNQIREFALTNQGIVLRDAYLGGGDVLTGSARVIQESKEESLRLRLTQEASHKQAGLAAKQAAVQAQIEAIRAEFAALETVAQIEIDQALAEARRLAQDRAEMAVRRMEAPL
jgi:circadian clock protein KaiC